MKVKILTPMVGNDFVINIGDEIETTREEAVKLINANMAVAVEVNEIAVEKNKSEIEQAYKPKKGRKMKRYN